MLTVSLRPTFILDVASPKQEFFRQLVDVLQTSQGSTTSLVFEDFVELHIPENELRYWSPHLSLHFEGDENHTRVFGRFAPTQNVWTFVWIVYLALAFAIFFALIYAYAQWSLGEHPWAIYIVPVAIIGIGLLYLASYVGQSWSVDQIHRLRDEWDRLVESAMAQTNSPS